MTAQQRSFPIVPNEGAPMPGERLMAFTSKFHCHGYIDGKGVWRLDKDSSPIENVLGWRSFD